jgi:signal transduction histidine kinase
MGCGAQGHEYTTSTKAWSFEVVVAKLDVSAERHRQIERLVETLPDAIIVIDDAGIVQFVNGAAQLLFSKPRREFLGQLMNFSVRDGDVIEIEIPLDDQMRIAEMRVVNWTWEGKPAQLAAIRDITDRRQIELQLHQAQKMEAIGNLTGGLAHDFNNLLAIVIGNLDLLSESPNRDARSKKLTKEALDAALRGADLVGRLLAFARRQPLAPEHVDTNEVVTRICELLQRTLGGTIKQALVLEAGVWPVLVDPAQFESSLINIANNARDAMPNGGTLTVATRNLVLASEAVAAYPGAAPGEYVVIEISDSGTGMPPNLLNQIFEPFFTTKEEGKGTGLGLSMVFGFAQQSGGLVSVASEVGVGTTFRLMLPRSVVAKLPAAARRTERSE